MITSAGAVEVYDLEQDTVSKFSLMASGYEVAAASTEAQMDELLADLGLGVSSPNLYTLGYWLNQIRANTREIANAFLSGSGLFFSDGYYLDSDGDSFYGMSDLSITVILQRGLLGLSENLKSLSSSFDLSSLVTAVNTNTTAVNAVTTAVNSNKSAVDLVRVAVNNTTSAVEDTTEAVETFNSDFLSYLSIPAGTTISGIYGQDTSFNTSTSFSTLFNYFSRGLLFQFYVPSSTTILGNNGQLSTITTGYPFRNLVNNGFRGLAYILRGTNNNSSFESIVVDNDGTDRSFTSVGLGPMIHDLLNEVAADSGLLTYIFASPEDLKMKANSESAVGAVTDNFISPSADTSVSVSDIGTLSSAAGSIESFGSTGVTPDQAFAQLGNDSIFEFFSQTTADNLDSRPSSYSLRDSSPQIVTNYYSESRTEFFNLIGEGSE